MLKVTKDDEVNSAGLCQSVCGNAVAHTIHVYRDLGLALFFFFVFTFKYIKKQAGRPYSSFITIVL